MATRFRLQSSVSVILECNLARWLPNARFTTLRSPLLKVKVFWDATPFRLVKSCQRSKVQNTGQIYEKTTTFRNVGITKKYPIFDLFYPGFQRNVLRLTSGCS